MKSRLKGNQIKALVKGHNAEYNGLLTANSVKVVSSYSL